MANQVWTLEDVNLFCGTSPDASQNSNHLTLAELKLPGVDMQFVDHRAGGAPVAIEVDTVIARLESTFVMVGVTPQVMKLVHSWSSQQNWFTAYGVIRDQMSGQAAQAMCVIHGKLGRADMQNYRRGDVMHTNYAIRGIIHYELSIAGDQIYLWDFATNTLVVGGVDQNAVINTYLVTGATNVQAVITDTGGWVPGV